MTAVQHFGSISGGKDSQAVLCRMVERIEAKGLTAFGNHAPCFLSADNGHENPITLDHVAYLDDWLWQRVGLHIEMVSANDVPGLTDEAAFARNRDRQPDRSVDAEMGGRESAGGDAPEPWPDWNGGLAHHLRLDDGLSAWVARTRVASSAGKRTSAASLIVEAFGDAVLPQIPEAIGRAILRTEAALDAVLSREFSLDRTAHHCRDRSPHSIERNGEMPEFKEAAADRSRFLSNDEAAAFLNLSPQTLNKYRVIGGGPPFRKFGRRVRYALEDLENWAAARRCNSTSDDAWKRASET